MCWKASCLKCYCSRILNLELWRWAGSVLLKSDCVDVPDLPVFSSILLPREALSPGCKQSPRVRIRQGREVHRRKGKFKHGEVFFRFNVHWENILKHVSETRQRQVLKRGKNRKITEKRLVLPKRWSPQQYSSRSFPSQPKSQSSHKAVPMVMRKPPTEPGNLEAEICCQSQLWEAVVRKSSVCHVSAGPAFTNWCPGAWITTSKSEDVVTGKSKMELYVGSISPCSQKEEMLCQHRIRKSTFYLYVKCPRGLLKCLLKSEFFSFYQSMSLSKLPKRVSIITLDSKICAVILTNGWVINSH